MTLLSLEKFWGFIVSIHQIEREEGHHKWLNFMCGGTIFSKRHVLTAAHCMIKWQIVKWGNKTLISELIPSDWLLPKDFMIASNSPMQEIGSIGQILHKVLSYKVHQKYVRVTILCTHIIILFNKRLMCLQNLNFTFF